MKYVTKYSGDREEYDTGAVRDNGTGKGRFDLISPFALKRLAGLYERGVVKYSSRNWESGIPFSRCTDSMLRHAQQWPAGDTEEDHLAAVAWNAFALMHYQELIKNKLLPEELDDMPVFGGGE